MVKFLKDINLKNKTALITGATKGIGRSTAIAMHQIGASIVAIGRNTKNLNSLKKKLKNRIKCIECDVNDYEKISKNKFFYDVIYNPQETNFLKQAKKFDGHVENGKMMFVYQAQKSFFIWHSVMPKIDDETINILNR